MPLGGSTSVAALTSCSLTRMDYVPVNFPSLEVIIIQRIIGLQDENARVRVREFRE